MPTGWSSYSHSHYKATLKSLKLETVHLNNDFLGVEMTALLEYFVKQIYIWLENVVGLYT